jgi:hypothetical protein
MNRKKLRVDDATQTDHLFFRLRIPKPLGDIIVDQAWAERRSVNSQVLMLLEQAVGWRGESLIVETSAGRGAKRAGSRRSMPAETSGLTDEQVDELKDITMRLSAILKPANTGG